MVLSYCLPTATQKKVYPELLRLVEANGTTDAAEMCDWPQALFGVWYSWGWGSGSNVLGFVV